MLDENLPTFTLKPSTIGIKHQQDFYFSHHGNEPTPTYSFWHADPASTNAEHKNCYVAALLDTYTHDIVFGEVKARPGWTQPTLSAEEARRQGGVPPPPQPIIPNEFVVQLYEPEQQVTVTLKSSTFGSDSYEFSLPETAFRTPSDSNLDRGQSGPASLDITPRINFVWRKESKLNKDLTCYMTGKSTDKKSKKSKRDPDIAIGLWRGMRELTIYESNLNRVDLEDPKGLEIVMLLSAKVIHDLYFSSRDHLADLFNISDAATRRLSSGGRKLSNPKAAYAVTATPAPNPNSSLPPSNSMQAVATSNQAKRNSLPRLQTTPPQSRAAYGQPPPMADPRAQWELDNETARLKAEQEAEARATAHRRRQKEKEDEAERRRLQRMVEEEERAAKKRQADIDKETERLRKMYGVTPIPQRPQQANSSSSRQSGQYLQPQRPPQMPVRPPMGSNGLYVQPSASASSVMMSGANGTGSGLNVPNRPAQKKKSFFGLRSLSDDAAGGERLKKKGSTMW